MNATIKSDLLIDLNRAGRNVLAYIIDNCPFNEGVILLDKVAIANYFAKRISPKYASTVNAHRGILDLEAKEVITRLTNLNPDWYQLNTSKLKLCK